jgi:hypothetical protein
MQQALTLLRHPEVLAKRASKGDGPSCAASSFEARKCAHLRMTGERGDKQIEENRSVG